MIYWGGINIGDWRFYAEIANIKSAILFQSEHAQWHVAQIRQLTSTGKFAKYYSRQILLSPINHLVWYVLYMYTCTARSRGSLGEFWSMSPEFSHFLAFGPSYLA